MMNRVIFLGLGLAFLSLAPVSAEEPNEKATKYHSALLKRPNGDYLFERFSNAWLDTGTITGLGDFLEGRSAADDASTADRLLYGYHLTGLGREVEALEVFQQALEAEPENGAAWAELAKVHARTLDFEEALAALENALVHSDDDEELSIELGKRKGRWLSRSGQTEAALAAWTALAEAHPDDDELREDLVDLLLDENLIEPAVETQRQLVEATRDPYHKITRRLRLGDILLRSGDLDGAKAIYGESLDAAGRDTWLEKEILSQIEQLFRREDDIAGLENYHRALIEADGGRIAVQRQLAGVLAEQEKGDEAVEVFRGILEVTPGDRENREAFVSLLGQLDRPSDAVAQMQALVAAFPADAELLARLAQWQHEAEDPDAARASVEAFLEKSDGSEYSHLRAARMLEQFEQADAAGAMFESLIAAFPESSGAVDEHAAFLHRNGEEVRAVELWKGLAADGTSQDAIRAARMLSSRGERDSAYEILKTRADEFSTDFVYLGRLIAEALASDHAEEALPWMRARVSLAESFSDLNESLRQALSVLDRAEKTEETLDDLRARQAALSMNETCLLVRLLEKNGEFETATAALDPWIEKGDPLALRQRVEQLESRNDWEAAALVMQRIVEASDANRSNHLEQLIELHRRALDYDAALEWVARWKEVSPGSAQPWLVESRVLQENGDSEGAIDRLRKAANRFEDEEGIRTQLASLYTQADQPADAERIYWNLFEESEDLSSKLRWVGQLSRSAEQQGKVDRLIEQFRERHRSNRSSIAPLLAIAEIHRQTDNYEGRREALLEATRLRPEDKALLQQIARIEESEGDWEKAVDTLESALPLDPTDETARRIALLYLRYGADDERYSRFTELAGGEAMEAKTVLGLADAMIAHADWERASAFLEEHRGRFPEDYRIAYLHAICQSENFEPDAAIEAFLGILDQREELEEVAAKQSQDPRSQSNFYESYGGDMPDGTVELMGLVGDRYQALYFRQNLQQGRVSFRAPSPLAGGGSMVPLPQNLETAHGFALTHLHELASARFDEEKNASLIADLKARGIDNAEVFLAFTYQNAYSGYPALNGDLLERFPENAALKGMLAYVAASSLRQNSNVAVDPDQMLTLADEFQTDYPQLAFSALAAAYGAGEETALAKLPDALAQVDAMEEKPGMIAQTATSLLGRRQFLEMPADLEESLFTWLKDQREKQIEERRSENPNLSPLAFFSVSDSFAALLRSSEDLTEFTTYLDTQSTEFAEALREADTTRGSRGGLGQYLQYYTMDRPLLAPLGFPPVETPEVAPNVLVQFVPDGRIGFGYELGPILPEAVEERLDQVTDPMLKAFLSALTDNEERTTGLVESLIDSARAENARLPLREALLGAGWYQRTEQWEKAATFLEAIRLRPMSRTLRERVDASLVLCAMEAEEPSDTLAELGREAALRLRYGFLSAEERGELVTALTDFGLDEQADRLAAKGVASQTRSASRGTSVSTTATGLAEQMTAFVQAGKTEQADKQLRRFLEQSTSQMARNPSGQWDYNVCRVIYELKRNHGARLIDAVDALKPGPEGKTVDFLKHAWALHLVRRVEEAGDAFETALASVPDNQRQRYLPITALMIGMSDPEAGRARLEQLEPKSMAQLAMASQSVRSAFNYSSERNIQQEIYQNHLEMVSRWLTELDLDRLSARTDLGWIESHLRNQFANSQHRHLQLTALSGDIENRYNDDNGTRGEAREVYDALTRSMIRIPQLARQGFAAHTAARIAEIAEPFTDPELVALAETALETAENRLPSGFGTTHYYQMHSEFLTPWTPSEYLLFRAHLTGADPTRADEILAKVSSSGDREAIQQTRAFHELLYGAPDTFDRALKGYLGLASGNSGNAQYYADNATLKMHAFPNRAHQVWKARQTELADTFDLETFIADAIGRARSTGSNEVTLLAYRHLRHIVRETGWAAAEPLLLDWTEAWLGPQTTWDRFEKEKQRRVQSGNSWYYQGGEFTQIPHKQYAGLLMRLGHEPAIAMDMLGFVMKHDLDKNGQISSETLLTKLEEDAVKKAEVTRALLETDRFLGPIAEFDPLIVGWAEKPVLLTLLEAVETWKKEDRAALRESLGPPRDSFGTKLVLATLDRKSKNTALGDLLAAHLDEIRALPEPAQEDLVDYAYAVFPKGIPTSATSPRAADLTQFLEGEKTKNVLEKSAKFLAREDFSDNTIRRGSDLVKEMGVYLDPLGSIGEHDKMVEIYWHALGLVNDAQKKPGGWGGFDKAWNAHGDILYDLIDDTPGGDIDRLVIVERIWRSDTEGQIATMPIFKNYNYLKARYDRAGGNDDLEKSLTETFSELWERAGPDTDPVRLAHLCEGFPQKMNLGQYPAILAWADENGRADHAWADFAKELSMSWRRRLAANNPSGLDGIRKKVPDFDAWQPHFHALMSGDTIPLNQRVSHAGTSCRVPMKHSQPDHILLCGEIMANAMIAEVPYNGWRFVDVVKAFNQLPVDDRWREIAVQFDEGWIAMNRDNHRDHSTGLPWDPWSNPVYLALETYVKLGDAEKLEIFRSEDNAQSRLENNARPTFCLVRGGFHEAAREELTRSADRIDIGTDYPNERNNYTAAYDSRIHEQIPAFLETIEDEPMRYFAEVVLRGAPDLPPAEQEKDAAYEPRWKRIADMARQFEKIDFTERLDLQTSILRQFALFDNGATILLEPITVANADFDLNQVLSTQNYDLINYGTRVPAAIASQALRSGDLQPVADFIKALNNHGARDYYREEAIEHFSERLASSVRNRAHDMPPAELQAHADALHLLLTTSEDEIVEHDAIRATLIGKLTADALSAAHPETSTQLPDTTFDPKRESRLEKVLAGNTNVFWGQMTTALKFKVPNPKVRPDDATRLQRVEAILAHPLMDQVLEKENELRAKLLRFEWVKDDEIDTDRIKKLWDRQ